MMYPRGSSRCRIPGRRCSRQTRVPAVWRRAAVWSSGHSAIVRPRCWSRALTGCGVGFSGPQGSTSVRNPSDNSLAVGPNHIVQIVNSRLAVFDRTGKVLRGPVATNTIFAGFGGPCEIRNNGDAVVRYDQLAGRWLIVMPIFGRIPDRVEEPYSMCYAVSTGPDPLGQYYRYEFRRRLFPDYPRPAIWPDGYYVPTSTGDEVIEKHACVADREKMLQGGNATEQCLIIKGVNFLNNADIDGGNSRRPARRTS